MTDELLIRFLLNETSEEEGLTVRQWLAADPENEKQFEQFERVWQASKGLSIRGSRNTDQAWERFRERVAASAGAPIGTAGASSDVAEIHTGAQKIVKLVKPGFPWMKIAAVLLLVGCAWMYYALFGPENYKDLKANGIVVVEQLPDGSELTLNKNAALSYVSNFKRHRNVKLLQGEVFFSVAHDTSKPFVVEIGQISVTVVGTSFNIKKLGVQTEVIVESGIVRVELNGRKIALHKGEKIQISDLAAPLVKEKNIEQLYNYYRSNLFIAHNTPLQKLVSVMNEAYDSQIFINDPELGSETINTTIKVDEGLDTNLNVLCQTLRLKAVRHENKILLSRSK